MLLTVENFDQIVPLICDRETTSDPSGWTPENPTYGHCAAVSLLYQNIFGGTILRASLLEFTEFAHMRSHYWIKQGQNSGEFDGTWAQFQGRLPRHALVPEPKERSYLTDVEKNPLNKNTVDRYKTLAIRLVKYFWGERPIFQDSIWKECFFAALESSCKAMKFGAAFVRNGGIILSSCNKIIEPLAHLCEPDCVRLSMEPRRDQLEGSCGHAEEWGMHEVVKRGVPLGEVDVYIVGLTAQSLLWIRKASESTCTLCARQMYMGGVKSVNVEYEGNWVKISPATGLVTADQYRRGEKRATRS